MGTSIGSRFQLSLKKEKQVIGVSREYIGKRIFQTLRSSEFSHSEYDHNHTDGYQPARFNIQS